MNETGNNYGISLPPFAQEALDILETKGFEAWCVGGFIRDAIRKQAASDIDIATAAPWEKVRDIFTEQHYKVFETGIHHGTVTVLIDNNPLEITTYRQESCYTDKRHPDSVVFVQSITEDLARRDFSMNAIAFHPKRGFYDPYGGQKDIERQIIRSVGDPEKRFSEDALRILRACRFASQLGFKIEPATMIAMKAHGASLHCIAAERIYHELDKLVCGSAIHDALMSYIEIVGQVVPEILPMQNFDQKTPYHIYDVLEHTAYCMQACPPSPLVRWSAFFHDMGKPSVFFTDKAGVGHFYGHAKISLKLAQDIMRRFKMPSSFMHDVELLVLQHDDVIPATTKAVKRALRRLDGRVDLFRALCDLKRGDALAQAPHCANRVALADELERVLDEILSKKEAFSLKDLHIDGNDFLAMGVPASPKLGTLLEHVLDAVIDEKIENNRDDLLVFAHKLVDR